MGEKKKSINKIPPKIPGQSQVKSLFMFSSSVFNLLPIRGQTETTFFTDCSAKLCSEFSAILRRTQEGCGGLRGKNPGVFPTECRASFPRATSFPLRSQTLAGILHFLPPGNAGLFLEYRSYLDSFSAAAFSGF